MGKGICIALAFYYKLVGARGCNVSCATLKTVKPRVLLKTFGTFYYSRLVTTDYSVSLNLSLSFGWVDINRNIGRIHIVLSTASGDSYNAVRCGGIWRSLRALAVGTGEATGR